jgi:hypothetical protein
LYNHISFLKKGVKMVFRVNQTTIIKELDVEIFTLGNASNALVSNLANLPVCFMLDLQNRIEEILNVKVLSVSLIPKTQSETIIYFVHEPKPRPPAGMLGGPG